MKVAVASQSGSDTPRVHSQFGRCDCFMIVDTESGDTQTIPNDSAKAATGAGTAGAILMCRQGVNAVIAGKVGPNAYEALTRAGIDVFCAPQGIPVSEALEKLRAGALQKMEIKRF